MAFLEEMELEIGHIWIYREEVGKAPCKPEKMRRKGMRACLGNGWGYEDCGNTRVPGRKQTTEVGQDQREQGGEMQSHRKKRVQ